MCGRAGRTQPGHDDLSLLDGSSSQLTTNGLGQIHLRSLAQIVALREESGELAADLRADLKAAGADSRPDRYQQILWAGSKLASHCGNRLWRYFRHCTPPTGMDGSHRPVAQIGHQDREAVGGTNRQRDTWLVRDHRIAFAEHTGHSGD